MENPVSETRAYNRKMENRVGETKAVNEYNLHFLGSCESNTDYLCGLIIVSLFTLKIKIHRKKKKKTM